MSLGEFDLIARYFTRPVRWATLGVGDDCALLPAAGTALADDGPDVQWAVSSDLLVEGRHFLSTVSPEALGHKTLAVNLSDLAACGARPRAYTLALALPRVEEGFLAGFARGLHALADAHGIELVGGDTTAGPLTLGITVMGTVPAAQALRRSAARVGDGVWVSGQMGDARLALQVFRGDPAVADVPLAAVRDAMERPTPRVALGLALRGIAHAAIDLSDGLLGDLGHVLRASGCGAELDFAALPRSALLAACAPAVQRQCLLTGGDDYELLFTAPASAEAAVRAAGARVGVAVTRIGSVVAAAGLRVRDGQGGWMDLEGLSAFDHFRSDAPGAA